MDFEKFFEEENEEQEFSFDYKRYLRGIYKRKWIVLAIFLVITIPWIFYVNSKPPVYETYTWVRFKNYDPEKLRLLNESRYLELTSRTSSENVVADLGLAMVLMEDDKKAGLMREDIFTEFKTNQEPEAGKYLLSFREKEFTLYRVSRDEKNRQEIAAGNLTEITDQVFTTNGILFRLNPDFLKKRSEIMFKVNYFRNAVNWFRSRIRVDMGRGGTLMQIRMIYDDPNIVAKMVNSLAEIYVNESISIEKRNAIEAKNMIQSQLKIAQANLQRDQEALREFQSLHPISLETDITNNVTNKATLQNRKKTFEDNIDNVEYSISKLDEFGKQTITPGQKDTEIRFLFQRIVSNRLFENNTDMGLLSQQLSSFEQERKKNLGENFPEDHKKNLEIDEKIVPLQANIIKTAKKIIAESKKQIANIDRQINSIDREINNLPKEKQQLANLENNVELSQTSYNDLQKRWNNIQISESATTEEIDIMDPAIPPEFPMNRGKRRNAAIGGFFALFLGLGLAVFIEFMDKTVKTPDDIKRHLKLNVIGTIPKIEFENEFEMKDADKLKQIDSQLVTYDYSPTPIGEAYRALRTKIVFSKNTGKIRTLVVSSFAPGDGKSFTSANLAVTLAQHKTNTLLIDSDLRRGVLHNTFGIPKEPGFSNFLMGMARFEDIIHETYVPNLSLISCGSMMPNPSELLGSIQLKRFIEEVKRRYDIVLFDSPPLNAATDSVVLGTQSDGLVLIVRADVTNRNVAKQKLDLFENVPTNLIGVILNGTDTELAHEGYSYYHY